MTFEDLPKDMRNVPITNAELARGLVDLFVFEASREEGCLLIVLLDDQGLAQDPILVGEVDDSREPAGARRFFDLLCTELGFPALILARGRPGGPMLTDSDRAWHQLFLDVCRAHDVRLAGAFLATPGEVRPFPSPLEVAS